MHMKERLQQDSAVEMDMAVMIVLIVVLKEIHEIDMIDFRSIGYWY